MKGSHKIIVQNKRIRYDFEIRRNITVIRGDSATGKTALVDMIREHYENGEASAPLNWSVIRNALCWMAVHGQGSFP